MRALQHGERDESVVGGGVDAGQRVVRREHRAGGNPTPRHVHLLRKRNRPAHCPHSGGEQRDVDDVGFTRVLAVEERGTDPARDGHGSDRVPVRRPWHRQGRRCAGRCSSQRAAAAVPVAERVVSAGIGIGTMGAVARTAHIDDAGIVSTDVVDVDLQLRAHSGHLVGEEHISGGGESIHDVATLGCAQVERQALLAAVGVLEQHVHLGTEDPHAGGREPAHRVAPLDVLDLDDLRAPVGQDRRGRGHEGVLGDLEDADTVHHVAHQQSLRVSRRKVLSRPSGMS